MVRVCAFPGCGKRMRSYNPESFHRLPLKEPTLKQWLVVLQIDVETPLHVLKEKDYRVCSRHFDAYDFNIPLRDPPVKVHLRKSAIPKATPLSPENNWAVMGGSEKLVESTGTHLSEIPGSTTNKPTLQHVVEVEAILQLMKNCPMCNRQCRCNKRTQGPYLIVYQSCYFCDYQRKWASQPEAKNIHNKRPSARKKAHVVNRKAASAQLHKTRAPKSS